MPTNLNFIDFPLELRLQIYRDYFKVDGGYVYDVKSDKLKTARNEPIDLSLIYACRSIANETKNLPLSLNTVTFSTLYREDWRSLAGCFNVIATYYYHLESDFVLHLAEFITSDMYSRLASKYPNFARQIEPASRDHHQDWAAVNDHDANNETTGGESSSGESASGSERPESITVNQSRGTHCGAIRDFHGYYVKSAILEPNNFYRGFSRIHRNQDRSHPSHTWSGGPWEIQDALSYCLRLIAENKPVEFANHIRATFPKWTGTDLIQDFFNLRFDNWVIPSESEVKNAIRLLGLGDIWRFPNMWHYAPSFLHNASSHDDDDSYSNDDDSDDDDDDVDVTGIASTEHDPDSDIPNPFAVRCREKIRFSAAANAIRFLKRIPSQRMQLKHLVLHEDFHSVNNPHTHALGLAPFIRENPSLQVMRRVSMLDCILGVSESPSGAAAYLLHGQGIGHQLLKPLFSRVIVLWLKDALAVKDTGIPVKSFTFLLEASPHQDYFADLFQQLTQRDVAWSRALKVLLARGTVPLESMSYQINRNIMRTEDVEAIDQLVNRTSGVLSADFNTGFAWDVEALVHQTERLDSFNLVMRWLDPDSPLELELPPDLTHKDRLADICEIQIEDGHLVTNSEATEGFS
ncbi:hypothetical protein IL306_015005 [Fusarium sp. DS 682]|nr:hypothetical protein IL306_015005 [Fusarium sp. DS 682]